MFDVLCDELQLETFLAIELVYTKFIQTLSNTEDEVSIIYKNLQEIYDDLTKITINSETTNTIMMEGSKKSQPTTDNKAQPTTDNKEVTKQTNVPRKESKTNENNTTPKLSVSTTPKPGKTPTISPNIEEGISTKACDVNKAEQEYHNVFENATPLDYLSAPIYIELEEQFLQAIHS